MSLSSWTPQTDTLVEVKTWQTFLVVCSWKNPALAGAGVVAAGEALGMLASAAAADKPAGPATAKNRPVRLCRYQKDRSVKVALFQDDRLIDLQQLAGAVQVNLPASSDLLDYLPPDGKAVTAVAELRDRYEKLPEKEQARLHKDTKAVKLLVPIPEPKKVILLAGNYAAHIIEGGGQAAERKDTFPYFFWKPPTTTLTNPGDPIRIPTVSPDHVDWEIELGVIIGRRCRDVAEKDALEYVAGYSVCNDVSDRKFQINPGRKKRDKDGFFDWLHGKWHDTFLPMGPCVRSAAAVPTRSSSRLQAARQRQPAAWIRFINGLLGFHGLLLRSLDPGGIAAVDRHHLQHR